MTAVAQDARSQARNRELALERLRARLASALTVPRARRPTKPTRRGAAATCRSKSGAPPSASIRTDADRVG